MKKLFLVIAVLFMSFSASYAYQVGVYAGSNYGQPANVSKTVNVNAFCSVIVVRSQWTNPHWGYTVSQTSGSLVAYCLTTGFLIGEYSFNGVANPGGHIAKFNQYIGVVQMYVSTINRSAMVVLEWQVG